MSAPKLPTQADVESYFKRLNNWGRWGQDDQRGTVNLITDARRAAARALVKSGRTVSLSREIVAQPHLQFMYHVTCPSKRERADVVLDRFDLVYHGFWITHVDALCHVGWDGELYNGRPFADSLSAAGSTWCPIDPLFDGILTRGVLLDVAAGRREGYVTVGNPVTPRELDETAARFGVRVEPGDVVVVRSGDEKFRRENPDWVPRVSPHPGLHVSCLEWFREKDIAAISWDMMDERPIGYAGFGMGVHLAIPFLGLALVDNTNPERLAQACAEEGRYEFLFTATPLRLVGATGAPAHPLAMFRSRSATAPPGRDERWGVWGAISGPPTSLDRVAHPDVGVFVASFVRLAIDDDGLQGARHDVGAGVGEAHVGPALPVGHRAEDDERARRHVNDVGAQPRVHADPRVERQAVLVRPARVALHRRERILALVRRAYRRDQCAQAVRARQVEHRADGDGAHALAAKACRHHRRERTEHVRGAARVVIGLRAAQDVRDARRQVLDRPVPDERHGVSRRDRRPHLVHDQQLPVRPCREQSRPVLPIAEGVLLAQEARPRRVGELLEVVLAIRPLAQRECFVRHAS